jgi:glycosyltransferase involved in cell wall biosynthesis
MIEEVLGMDIGLFPLQDVEASIVRGVLKATVYMAGEAVVVCSRVGQSLDMIQDGVNGMLASSSEEWEKKIELLITNPILRERITKAGLETVREGFRVEKSFLKLCSILDPTSSRGESE